MGKMHQNGLQTVLPGLSLNDTLTQTHQHTCLLELLVKLFLTGISSYLSKLHLKTIGSNIIVPRSKMPRVHCTVSVKTMHQVSSVPMLSHSHTHTEQQCYNAYVFYVTIRHK